MCRSLLRSLPEIERRLSSSEPLNLFSDFDGTLAHLVPDPRAAHLSGRTREVLRRLSRKRQVILAFVSGRSLADLYSRIAIAGAAYAGNHGLEIRAGQTRFVEPAAAALRSRLCRLSMELAAELGQIDNAFVEYKGLTTSVHFRNADPQDVPAIESIMRAAVANEAGRFRIANGKMIFEILPVTDWHKGRAVRWIDRHHGVAPRLSIYLGDDRTDEDAFQALPGAITVRVGSCAASSARYRTGSPREVRQFLTWLADRVN